MNEKLDLSIILACYNDAIYLEKSVEDILKVLRMTRLKYEIIFVYDCGTDDTLAVIENIIKKYGARERIRKIVHEKNEGRGRSVCDGIKISCGDVVGYIDVDLDVHPRYVPSMMSAIIDDGYDVATAFRYYKIELNPEFLLRHILSHGYRFISRFLLEEGLKDSESGYKFFNRAKVAPLAEISRYKGWFWDTEIMVYCIRSGFKIKEIPCVDIRRKEKASSVRIMPTVIEYLSGLIEFRSYLAKHGSGLSRCSGSGHDQ